MSPLRYQKWLRLNEVRRPMLNEHYDVTTAAYAVGYESYPISVGNIRGCWYDCRFCVGDVVCCGKRSRG